MTASAPLPFLRYVGEPAGTPAPAGRVAVRAPHNAVYEFSDDELALALLFDGQTAAEARRLRAVERLKREVPQNEMAMFAARLGQAGLMQPGRDEPLPPPRANYAGNVGAAAGFPPSHLAGSLAGPGYAGSLVGFFGSVFESRGGWKKKVEPGRWLKLGHALNRFLDPPALRYGLWAFSLIALIALWFERVAVAVDAVKLVRHWPLFAVGVTSTAAINALTQLTRAAAIQRYTGAAPVIHLRLALGFFPSLETQTEGAAERANVSGRLRIIGAPMQAMVLAISASILGWFLFHRTPTALPMIFLGFGSMAMYNLLLRANPLSRRDGYYLLANLLGVPDLRDQAMIMLFNRDRPWAMSQPPSPLALRAFGIAAMVYVVVVIAVLIAYPGHWLETSWGGAGVAMFLAGIALTGWIAARRFRSERGRIGGPELNLELSKPERKTWLIFLGVTIVCLFPYTYEPSGELVIQPHDRAEVRSLVRGQVDQVMVKEGDLVQAGQELLHLSDYQQRAQFAASEAKLKQLQADLALALAGARTEEIEIAKQRVTTAATKLDFSSQEASRMEMAYKRHAVSIQDFQRAQGVADVNKQELAEAHRQLELVTGGTRAEKIDALKSEVAAQEADLAYMKDQYDNTHIRAPIAGKVASSELQFARGKYLDVGAQIAVIEDNSSFKAEVQVPEAAAADIAVGERVHAKVWALPGTSLDGTVTEVAPIARDSPTGKVVRVRLDLDRSTAPLLSELTGQAKIEGRTYPAIVVFTKAIVRFLMVEVWSWLP